MVTELGNAKINLTLDILGTRTDGYHEVEMIMQTLELADVIEIDKLSNGIKLEITGDANLPTDERNLAYKAALAINEFCDKNLGVTIKLQKKIPQAAGLAGGSADAAAVIRGMNRLYDLNLNVDELCKIGEKIGADVPFCILGGTYLAQGRGERLTRLNALKNFNVVLAKPYGEISTAWAYKTYDENPATIHPSTLDIINLLSVGNYERAFTKFINVLESVALQKFPEIKLYKDRMIRAGAKVALMTGSGPTIFALTDNEEDTKKIASSIETSAQVFITKFTGV